MFSDLTLNSLKDSTLLLLGVGITGQQPSFTLEIRQQNKSVLFSYQSTFYQQKQHTDVYRNRCK